MINQEYLQYLKFPPGLEGDWSDRSESFLKAFNMLKDISGQTIVELGTTRSYVSGGFDGCLSSDTKYWKPDNPAIWDWQAGCFTIVAAEFCKELKNFQIDLHTVDLSLEHIERCKIMTKNIYNRIHYHISDSVSFLRNFDKQIDLLYVDTGDPNIYTQDLQLEEAKAVVEKSLISKNGIILIDDVFRPTQYRAASYKNKAELSIPFYLQNGFELVYSNYQTLLRKKI